LNGKQQSNSDSRVRRRERQGKALQEKEADFRTLASQEKKQEFFKQIIPLLSPLKTYIDRRLRIAELTLLVRTPIYTSGDILDGVVLQAYEAFDKRPDNLSLEEWLYRLTHHALDKYLHERQSAEARRDSIETLQRKELRTLEEQPITADVEGETWLPEDLDDSEFPVREFDPPVDTGDPEKEMEQREQVLQILQALSQVPEPERILFELLALQGFSKEEVGRIYNVSPDEIQRIVDRVRVQVRNQTKGERGEGEKTL
jgi:RNA polymerase sigma factor (sigma-70 family)